LPRVADYERVAYLYLNMKYANIANPL